MNITTRTKCKSKLPTPSQVAFTSRCIQDYMLRRRKDVASYNEALHGKNNCCDIHTTKTQIVAVVYFKD